MRAKSNLPAVLFYSAAVVLLIICGGWWASTITSEPDGTGRIIGHDHRDAVSYVTYVWVSNGKGGNQMIQQWHYIPESWSLQIEDQAGNVASFSVSSKRWATPQGASVQLIRKRAALGISWREIAWELEAKE